MALRTNVLELLEAEHGPRETLYRAVDAEIIRAVSKHGLGNNRNLTVALMEEVGELAQAQLDGKPLDQVHAEAVQVIGLAVRIIEEGDAAFEQPPSGDILIQRLLELENEWDSMRTELRKAQEMLKRKDSEWLALSRDHYELGESFLQRGRELDEAEREVDRLAGMIVEVRSCGYTIDSPHSVYPRVRKELWSRLQAIHADEREDD